MLPELSDIEIVGYLNQDSVEAFEALYQKYHRVVFANISKFIVQTSIAEDILQDVFMALWENRREIDPGKGVANWLFVVSYNKSLALLKKRVNEEIIFSEKIADVVSNEGSSVHEIAEQQLSLINDAVNALSPRRREAFELCRLQGKSYSEAANTLGISTETVKNYLKESLKFIRNFVFSKYPDSTFLFILLLAYYL